MPSLVTLRKWRARALSGLLLGRYGGTLEGEPRPKLRILQTTALVPLPDAGMPENAGSN